MERYSLSDLYRMLGFFLAASAGIVGLLLITRWIKTKQNRGALSGVNDGRAMLGAAKAVRASSDPKRSAALSRGAMRMASFPGVSATPTRIIPTAGRGISRKAVIVSDFATRVSSSEDVTATTGLLVPANTPFEWPEDLGPDDTVWAVRGGANNANVSVYQRSYWKSRE